MTCEFKMITRDELDRPQPGRKWSASVKRRAREAFAEEPSAEAVVIVPRNSEPYDWPRLPYQAVLLQDGKGMVRRGPWCELEHKRRCAALDLEILDATAALTRDVFAELDNLGLADAWEVFPTPRLISDSLARFHEAGAEVRLMPKSEQRWHGKGHYVRSVAEAVAAVAPANAEAA